MNGNTVLIYGAAGYTWQLISHQALQSGLNFEIAGRDATRIAPLAHQLGVDFRVFSVDDADGLRRGLEGVKCILNCAGPFSKTAQQLMDACIAHNTHYLDITAEFSVFALGESKSEAASASGVMLLPGVGWDVVPSDCLALHTSKRIRHPQLLRIALKHFGGFSRGSVLSSGGILELGPLVRSNGQIRPAAANPMPFDFGNGPENCVLLPMGDLITAWKSTAVPNIEVYFQMGLTAPANMRHWVGYAALGCN